MGVEHDMFTISVKLTGENLSDFLQIYFFWQLLINCHGGDAVAKMVKSDIIPMWCYSSSLCDQTLLSLQIQFLLLRLPCQMLDFEITYFHSYISKYLSHWTWAYILQLQICKYFTPVPSILVIWKHFSQKLWAVSKGRYLRAWKSILNWPNFPTSISSRF